MRSGKAVLLACVLLFMPSLARAAAWPNEPTDHTTLMDCPFSTVLCPPAVDVYGSGELFTDFSAPISPPSVLNQILRPGQVNGGTQWDYFFTGKRQIYFAAYINTNTEYTLSNVGVGKLFFLGDGLTNSYVGYAGGYGNFDKIPFYNNQNSGIWNNCHLFGVAGNYGDCPGGLNFFGNVNGAAVVRGSWHLWEVCRYSSSSPTSTDGILRLWIDSTLRLNYTTLNQDRNTNYLSINSTWDGASNVTPGKLPGATWRHLFDHIHLSVSDGASRCGIGSGGSGGGTTPPTPTPPPPIPPPPPGIPGTVSTLTVVPQSSTTALASFTAVDDGTGAPAKYDNRLSVSPINWGSTPSVSSGPCASPFNPAGLIGSTVTCLLSGLTPGQSYQLENVALRGTMNAGATYGALGNVASFTMPSSNVPAITNFTPASGATGVSVTITGSNFGATVGGNTVKFNGQTATVTSASATSLTVTAPDGVTTGKVSVQTDQGIVYSDQNFTVGGESSSCGCS